MHVSSYLFIEYFECLIKLFKIFFQKKTKRQKNRMVNELKKLSKQKCSQPVTGFSFQIKSIKNEAICNEFDLPVTKFVFSYNQDDFYSYFEESKAKINKSIKKIPNEEFLNPFL